MGERRNIRFLRNLFRRFYEEGGLIEAPSGISHREFGFLTLDRRIMVRHLAFEDKDDLLRFLIKKVPADCYRSAAYYMDPSASEMKGKGWLGSDIVFDIDADHIPSLCKERHDKWMCLDCGDAGKGSAPDACPRCGSKRIEKKLWFCSECLKAAKLETIKLLDFLTSDFGLSDEEISIYFSVTGDTPILIEGVGLVPIKDAVDLLKRGKTLKVLSQNRGKVCFSKVYGYLEHEEEVLKVFHEDSPFPIKITKHHSVYVMNDEGRIEPKKASELKEGDYLITFHNASFKRSEDNILAALLFKFNKRAVNEDVLTMPELMRLIGYYLAKGSIYDHQLRFSFNSKEIAPIEDCINLIGKIGGRLGKLNSQPFETQIILCFKKCAAFFEILCGKGADEKHLPSFIWTASKPLILELLKGYFRGDCYGDGGLIKVESMSEKLISEILWLCKMNGITCSISAEEAVKHKPSHGVAVNGGVVYKLTIPKAELFPEFLRGRFEFTPFQRERVALENERVDVEMERAPHRFNATSELDEGSRSATVNYRKIAHSDLSVVRVTKIEKAGFEKVYDICVTPTEAFFGGYYPILLHNSGHRGYHVHVESEELRALDQDARREVVDYIAGFGINPSTHGLLNLMGEEDLAKALEISSWAERLMKAGYELVLKGGLEDFMKAGLNKKAALLVVEARDRIIESWWRGEFMRAVRGLGRGSWRRIFLEAAKMGGVLIDTVVTTDVHRLIRLEGTIHSKTGFRKVRVSKNLESFDPLKEAVAFRKGEVRVRVSEAPEFRVGESVYGPYEDDEVELPTAAAVLLICKGLAYVV